MSYEPRLRGTAAKAFIAFAVLMPALLLVGVFIARSRGVFIAFPKGRLQFLFVADAAILALGFLLHRGEDL